jgi:hypothetical protein
MSDISNNKEKLQKQTEEWQKSAEHITVVLDEPFKSLILRDLESSKLKDEIKSQLIRSYAKSILSAVIALFILGGFALSVYLTSSKAVGEASSFISTIVSALAAGVAGYYFGRSKEQSIENRVEEIRLKEKDLYERVSKDIKSIIEKAR